MPGKTFDERIDDYKDTIFAMIGFAMLFSFDDSSKSLKPDVKVAQGRRMKTSAANRATPNAEVTPDLCIQDASNNKGLVAEIKKSFPANTKLWMDDFKQLVGYDDNLLNWLTDDGTVEEHELALLLEQGRARAIIRYYEEHKQEIGLVRNLIVVQFNRSDEANPYFFFRREHGNLKHFSAANQHLEDGRKVPLKKLAMQFEKVKLYDSPPPLPYLLHLIWDSVVLRWASDDERFAELKKRKLPVPVTVDGVVNELHENYSFRRFNSDNNDHQPRIPPKSWVVYALNALVVFKLAEWTNERSGECTVYFKRFKDTLKTFKELCAEHQLDVETEEKQMELFGKAG